MSSYPQNCIWSPYGENHRSAPAEAVWESFKLHARMSLTSHINKIETDTADTLDRAVAELSFTEQGCAAYTTPATASALKLQTRVVTQLQYEKARQIVFCKKKKRRRCSRMGKRLANS